MVSWLLADNDSILFGGSPRLQLIDGFEFHALLVNHDAITKHFGKRPEGLSADAPLILGLYVENGEAEIVMVAWASRDKDGEVRAESIDGTIDYMKSRKDCLLESLEHAKNGRCVQPL